MLELTGQYGSLKIFTDSADQETISQLYQYLNHPIAKKQTIRIMPDCHAGKGSVVGFTATMHPEDWTIPNTIGVDIGCGVASVCIGKKIPALERVDEIIKNNIPSGFQINDTPLKISGMFQRTFSEIAEDTGQDVSYVLNSLGTLGGGNHFIEIGLDSNYNYWLTVHSGSRNFGLKIANYYQQIAKDLSKNGYMTKEELREKINNTPPKERQKMLAELKKQNPSVPSGMEYLKASDAKRYYFHMGMAQTYASLNRQLIIEKLITLLDLKIINKIESVHNYIDFEDRIIRKGAIRAHEGELVVIPVHMKFGIVIGKGKGNPDWNYSAPHGAGRKMSRAKAKEALNIDEVAKDLKDNGIYTTTINRALDEAPAAYKDPEKIIKYLEDTVEVLDVIKPVYNFKG